VSPAEDLRPARPRVERLYSRLDGFNERGYGRSIGLPGEMDAEHISFVGRTEPEFVGRDGSDFCALHQWRDGVSEPAQRIDGRLAYPLSFLRTGCRRGRT
jgi:hypothetical protein